jgi:hypothetical protein
MSRRTLVSLVTVFAGVTIGMLWSRRGDGPAEAANSPHVAMAGTRPVPVSAPREMAGGSAPAFRTDGNTGAAVPDGPVEARITLADDLNAHDGTIKRDLEILDQIFAAWRTNYPRYGNPIGENIEITGALTGGNTFKLALVPKDHPAINADGELCDRWGTPFRFHQISGDRMEIRSAGPDRKFGTADDALFTP